MVLWKECVAWLGNFKVIPPGHKLLQTPYNSKLSDFVALIRDGVLLCQLVHSLDPSSVDMTRVIYSAPESQTGRSASDFICRHNIFLFLHAIVSNFYLNTDEHFFEPEDLYLCQNIGNVIETLSALSHCNKVKRSSVPGFPKKEKHLAKKIKNEENIYSSMKEIYGDAETEYIYDSFAKDIYNDTQDNYENIYQTICAPKTQRFSLEIFGSSLKSKSKRDLPINELIDTEDKYLENLIMVRDVFRDQLTLLSSKDKELIFYKLDELIRLHTEILTGLNIKGSHVGEIFLRLNPIIARLYGDYCVHLPRSMDFITVLEKEDPKLRAQLFTCQAKARPTTFPLTSHLILPFQRFLKYHLLLKEILKLTPEDHPEYSSLKRATSEMSEVGERVNERKRDFELAQQQIQSDENDLNFINRVEKTIKLMQLPRGAQLSDFGRLRKAGELTAENSYGARLSDYAFLFDTIILLCTRPKWLQHRYRFRTAVKIRDYRIGQTSPSHPNSIPLFHRIVPHPTPHLLFVCRNAADREVWRKAITDAVDVVEPKENAERGHVLAMTTFKEETSCYCCNRIMAGIFFQGYRCQRCQALLHKKCIGDYPCLEVGSTNSNASSINNNGLTKCDSVTLPTVINEPLERSESTLSLSPDSKQPSADRVSKLQRETEEELINIPVERQSWFAGDLNPKTASVRLQSLPVGTFLVRKRVNGGYALALNTPGGVKHMCIQSDEYEKEFYFSDAKRFKSIAEMIIYYRNRELTDNFNYDDLKGVHLRTPFKDI
ncbi:protein vav isoform X2 [Lepeophtheirus salmonis]